MRGHETRCPFCEAELDAVAPAAARGPNVPLTRAAILFASAATVAACVTGGPDPGPSSSSSGASSSGNSTSSSGVAPAYGVPEIDSGEDSGGPVALYGPAPVDGGS